MRNSLPATVIIPRASETRAQQIKAQSHIRDARSAHRKIKNKTSASLCVQVLSEFGRSQRVDNACTACCQGAGHIGAQSARACRAHTERTLKKNPTLARGTNGPLMKRARAQRTTSERLRSDDCAYKKRRLVLPAVISKQRRDEYTPEFFNMPTKRGNAMSVNPTQKTPAPVEGCRGRGSRGRGGRGRSKELPILNHAAVDEDDVEPLTRSPSSSPQVSPTRSGSGECRVLLPSQASKRRKDNNDNKLADDEANEMLWDKKATNCRRPDLKKHCMAEAG